MTIPEVTLRLVIVAATPVILVIIPTVALKLVIVPATPVMLVMIPTGLLRLVAVRIPVKFPLRALNSKSSLTYKSPPT